MLEVIRIGIITAVGGQPQHIVQILRVREMLGDVLHFLKVARADGARPFPLLGAFAGAFGLNAGDQLNHAWITCRDVQQMRARICAER